MREQAGSLKDRIRQLEAELEQKNRLLAEAEARQARYRQVVDSNMVGVLFWHVDGRMLDANDKVLEITGYSREDLQQGAINWLAMTPEEYADRERNAWAQLSESGVCSPFEKEYIRKDGSRVPILIGGAFMEGSREEGVCFVLDISDKHLAERRLESSERLFETFMDNSPTVAFLKDAEGRRVYLNRRYREVFEDGAELLGRTDQEMFGDRIAQALRDEDITVLATGKELQSINTVPTPDGVTRTWLTYKFPVTNEAGTSLVGGMAVDVTSLRVAQEQLLRANEQLEQRIAERTHDLEHANRDLRQQILAREQAEHELRKSEARFRKWLEQSVMPIQVVTPQGHTILVNRAWERLWGVTLADLEGYNMLADPQMEERGLAPYVRRAIAGEAAYIPETPYAPDRGLYAGQLRWSRAVIYPVRDDATGEVEEIVLLHDDVTERKAVEQSLHEEQRILRKLLDLHEQERKLIAYEIHDGLVQDLTGGTMLLETYNELQPHGDGQSLAAACRLFRKAINEARRLISGLRPLVIDEHGIVQAIQYLIAEEAQRSGPVVQLFHRVQFDRLPPLLEGTLYRIVQEAVTNAKRHSGSSEVEIWLQQEGSELRLIVRDYGSGFDVSQVPDDRFGLEGMKKRSQIFGGRCLIESEIGEGTTVRVSIPLPANP